MKKLRLEIDALEVESFEAVPARVRHGTVAAYYEDPATIVLDPSYDGTCGTCIGPTYCCPVSWDTKCVIVGPPNTASRIISVQVDPCTCNL